MPESISPETFTELRVKAKEVTKQYIETMQSFQHDHNLKDHIVIFVHNDDSRYDSGSVFSDYQETIENLISFFLTPENSNSYAKSYANTLNKQLPNLLNLFRSLQSGIVSAQLDIAKLAFLNCTEEDVAMLKNTIDWYTMKLEEANALEAIYRKAYPKH